MPTIPTLAPSGDHAARTRGPQPMLDRSEGRTAQTKHRARPGQMATRPGQPTKAKVGIIIAILLVSSMLVLTLTTLPSETEAYTPHSPISIVGDGGFTSENGVVSGSGLPSDPYVISGWEIHVGSGPGISISQTIASFVVEDVHVNGTAIYSDTIYGIYLYKVSNGRVKDSLVNNTNIALYIFECSNLSVQQNDLLYNNQVTIAISDCVSTNVVGNHILGSYGIDADGWDDSVVYMNSFQWCEMGILVWDGHGLDIGQNTFDNCQYCASFVTSEWSSFHGNTGTGCWFGVRLSMCFNMTVLANSFSVMTATGITVNNFSFDILVAYNRLLGCEYGSVWVDNANNVVIRDNTLENGEMTYDPYGGGVFLDTNGNVSVYHNNFVNNIDLQGEDWMGPENRWNDSYPSGGNWWSDYIDLDENSGPKQDDPSGPDGIWDHPYVLDADSQDSYPLASQWNVNSRPVADFTVTPSGGDTTTLFELNGSSSSDPDEGCGDSVQKWRWDLDGDGNWDRDWSAENVTEELFPLPGTYTIVMEVVDSNGLASLCSVEIVVSEYVIPEFGPMFVPVTLAGVALMIVGLRRMRSRPSS